MSGGTFAYWLRIAREGTVVVGLAVALVATSARADTSADSAGAKVSAIERLTLGAGGAVQTVAGVVGIGASGGLALGGWGAMLCALGVFVGHVPVGFALLGAGLGYVAVQIAPEVLAWSVEQTMTGWGKLGTAWKGTNVPRNDRTRGGEIRPSERSAGAGSTGAGTSR